MLFNQARDADEGLNALIRYSMAPDAAKYNREFENRFSINAVSGKVNVKQSLVQDAGRSLHYLVKATDSNGSLNGKSALLHLTVSAYILRPMFIVQKGYDSNR